MVALLQLISVEVGSIPAWHERGKTQEVFYNLALASAEAIS
jgi:hypothetical protein